MKRFRLLAVASAKGSPGCSFVATGLAAQLAERGIQTLLVDADAEERGIASLLDLPAAPPAARRLGGLGVLERTAVEAAAVRVGVSLHCLDLNGARLDGRDLAGATREAYGAVVADLGHQFGDLQRGIAAAADWLVWVASPDRVGVERADRVLGNGDLVAKSIGLLLNRCGGHALGDAGVVLAERHQLPVLGRFREAAPAARRAVRLAQPANRAREFRRSFDELARSLHPDLQVGSGPWS